VTTRNRWNQPPTSWEPTLPGWAPLVDHGPLPLQSVRSAGRWLWFTLATGGFGAVTGFVFAHDDPTPGLSVRGLLTVALAALVVALLTIHRRNGPRPLARAVAEYAVVFLLATLVATTGITLDQPTAAGGKTASAAPGQRPALVKTIDSFRDWLSQWRDWARTEADHRPQSSSAPAPVPFPSTRRPL
jgi:hypothetical protein